MAMQEDKFRSLKFLPPKPPPGLVDRPRLARALADGLSGKVILLTAPAGYGKTTLLASMVSQWQLFADASTATSVAWYTLDRSDNDAAAFMSGLLDSVRQVVPEFGTALRAILKGTPDARSQIRGLLALFRDELREAGQGGLALVLDGFHVLADRAIVDALESSFRDPENPLRWVVASRSDPRLYLSPLRSIDSLVELGADDLAFSSDEARQLLETRSGAGAKRRLVEAILRETSGWPSAANLAALIAAREQSARPFERLGTSEHGYRRLVRELLAGVSPELRDGLLKVSLLRYLSPELCREAIDLPSPSTFMANLRASLLPTHEQGDGETLCLEPQFRGALEQEWADRSLPHEQRALKRRVASNYLSSGIRDEGVRCLLEAGEAEEAAKAMEWAIDVELDQGHLDLALQWVQALPASIRRQHPRLMVLEGKLALARERVDDGRVLLVAAKAELEASDDQLAKGQLLGGWAALRLLEGRYRDAWKAAEGAIGHFSAGSPSDSAEVYWLLSRALELMGELDAAFHSCSHGLMAAERSHKQDLVVRAMLQLSRLAYQRGDLKVALAIGARAAHRSALSDAELLPISSVGGIASASYLDRGQPQEAALVAARALEASERRRDDSAQVRACLALANGCERLGQREFALEKLSQALLLSARLPSHMPERALVLQSVAASLFRHGKRREAKEKATEALKAAMASSHPVLIDQCRLALAAGKADGPRGFLALLQIRGLRRTLERQGSRRWLAGALQLMAVGYQRLRIGRLARRSLRKSLEIAAEEPYVGAPQGLPLDTDSLLRMAVQAGICHESVGTLLGVGTQEARGILAPYFAHKKPAVRKRAEEAMAGLDMGVGKGQEVRLLWPGLPEGEGDQPAELFLRTFGGLVPYVGGQAAEWPSADARNLVAYLLVNRSLPIPLERALGELWPGVEAAQSNLRLQVGLYQLRETLGAGYPPIDPALDGEGVLFWDGAGCSVDSEAFREAIERAHQQLGEGSDPVIPSAAVSLLEEAVDLYRGAFLADVDFDWCRSERGEMRSRLQWALRVLVDYYMARREWGQAVNHGTRFLRIAPLQEEMARNLMICHHQMGDRDGTLATYLELRRQIARKRASWPSKETQELRVQLLGM